MNLFKKSMMVVATAQLLVSQFAIAGVTNLTTIDEIKVKENRIFVHVSPSLGIHSACSDKGSVEIKNVSTIDDNVANNRDILLNIAIAAKLSGTQVKWETTGECSNVSKAIVNGIHF